MRGKTGLDAQPLPRVDPALLLADLLDEPEANVLPALDNADLEGLPNVITSLPGRQFKSDRQVGQPLRHLQAVPRVAPCPCRAFNWSAVSTTYKRS